MSSEIGWIDFSPNHRNRIKQFIELMDTGGVMKKIWWIMTFWLYKN